MSSEAVRDVAGDTLESPLGLIAGSGDFPREFIKNAKERGFDVVMVAHSGETEPELESLVSACAWIKVGQIGHARSFLKKHSVKQVALVGGISKARVIGGMKFDWLAVKTFLRIRSLKDDVLLRGLVEEIEKAGISVISPAVLLPEAVPSKGVLTDRGFTSSERKDAAVGWDAVQAVGALDIGQTVIVSRGVVIAVEAVEGTDAAILRAGSLMGGKRGVVVKLAKPQQELRVDMPAIGVKTVRNMAEAGCSALAVEAGKVMMLEPAEIIALANQLDIAIQVFGPEGVTRTP